MPSRLPRLAIGRRPIQPRQAEPRARRALERAAAPRFAAFDSRAGRRIAPEWRHPSRKATVSPSPSPPTQRRRRRSDPASVSRCRAMPTTSGGRRLRAKSDGPGPQSLRVCRCPPGSRSRERTLRSESQMAVLSIELPESVLDALAERVAARVLERLTDGQDGDRWLDAKQAADYLGRSINALNTLTAAGNFPPSRKLPGHKLWFRLSQLDHWRSGAAPALLLPNRFHGARCRQSPPAREQKRNPSTSGDFSR